MQWHVLFLLVISDLYLLRAYQSTQFARIFKFLNQHLNYQTQQQAAAAAEKIFIFASSSSSLGLVNLLFDVDTHQEN